jgi:hypothetical protein
MAVAGVWWPDEKEDVMTGLQYLQQHQIAKYDTEQVNDQR